MAGLNLVPVVLGSYFFHQPKNKYKQTKERLAPNKVNLELRNKQRKRNTKNVVPVSAIHALKKINFETKLQILRKLYF